jgi:2-succinyl-6-hydroxy-2,4-cyclohexadiene-1-carboxylate synthase
MTDNLNIHLETAGSGEPLVLLHGFMGSTKSWTAHIPVFSQYYRVITLDLPGHGNTESPDDISHYTMKRCMDILWSVFQYLKIEKAHLLGYSMGGRVALSYAVTHPELIDTLILESSSPGLAEQSERDARAAADERLATEIERDGLEKFIDYWQSLPLFDSQKNLPQSVRAELRAGRLNNNPRGLANSLRGMGTGAQPSFWDALEKLNIPTLLIAGELDTKYTEIAKKMVKLLPDAKVALFHGAGHTVHLERQEAFDKRVLEFLRDFSTISAE